MTKTAGVIGAGYWGKKHVEEYSKLGLGVCVADVVDGNREYCSKNFGAKAYDDYHQMLANEDVRYVSVCTPNPTHYKIGRDCIEAGKHVLIEKPLVLNLEDGKSLAQLARQRGVTVNVGHVFRFNNAVNEARRLLRSGEIGNPYLLKLKWTNLEPVFGDRDVIFDLAPHPFDIVNYFFDADPDEISCVAGAYRQYERVEAAFINCKLKDTIINIETSWITPKKERSIALVGEKKTVFADCGSQKISVFDNESRTLLDVPVTPNNTIQDELRAFVSAADRGDASVSDIRVGMRVIRMLELAEESLRKKMTIKVGAMPEL